MKPENIDYTLYLVTDRGLSRERTTQHIVEAALRGGVTCVQLREKTCSTREFIDQALSIKDHLKRHNIPLIINDRVDIAQAVNADGVHLGQSDMPIKMAKAILKDSMIIGISAESIKEAVQAEKDGADYIGVGAIYATPTKTDTSSPLGPEGIHEIRKSVKIPLVAIGGLNIKNVGEVIKNGADGVAVVSAIVAANDPEKAARDLIKIIQQARGPKTG